MASTDDSDLYEPKGPLYQWQVERYINRARKLPQAKLRWDKQRTLWKTQQEKGGLPQFGAVTFPLSDVVPEGQGFLPKEDFTLPELPDIANLSVEDDDHDYLASLASSLFDRLHAQKPLHKVYLPPEMFEKPPPPPAKKDFFKRMAAPKKRAVDLEAKEREMNAKNVKLVPMDPATLKRLATPKYMITWKKKPERLRAKGWVEKHGQGEEAGREEQQDLEEDEVEEDEITFEQEIVGVATAVESEKKETKESALSQNLLQTASEQAPLHHLDLSYEEPTDDTPTSQDDKTVEMELQVPKPISFSRSENLDIFEVVSRLDINAYPSATAAWSDASGSWFATLRREGSIEKWSFSDLQSYGRVDAMEVTNKTLKPGPRLAFASIDASTHALIGSITDLRATEGMDVRFSTVSAWDAKTLELLWTVEIPLAPVSLNAVKKNDQSLLMIGFSNGEFEFRRIDTGAEVWEEFNLDELGEGIRQAPVSTISSVPEHFSCYLAVLSRVVEATGDMDEDRKYLSVYDLEDGKLLLRSVLQGIVAIAARQDVVALAATIEKKEEVDDKAPNARLMMAKFTGGENAYGHGLNVFAELDVADRVESMLLGSDPGEKTWNGSVALVHKSGSVTVCRRRAELAA
ncbi:hypothetical protein BC829DRAFT_473683 [Chytridium lagenaria]|nr:hypothetical protein BC829DRAFT_473683 [Chytridium lagenaria]